MREHGGGPALSILTQRTPAIVVACAGWALALVCAGLTVTRGWGWLAPMGALLVVANTPLVWLLWGARIRLRSDLGRIPPRRYRLPMGGTVEGARPVEVVTDQGAEVTDWRIQRGAGQGGALEKLALRAGGSASMGAIRVRYPGVPFLSALPCVVIGAETNRAMALTWSGPGSLLVVEFGDSVRHDPEFGPSACFDGALAALETADARRMDDLTRIGELHAVPRDGPARILTEAEYDTVGVIPLAVVSDFLALMELEFAAPWGEGIRSERRNVEGTDGRTSFEGVFVSGKRALPREAGWLVMELVLVRLSEDTLAAFARRTTLGSAAEPVPE